VIERLTVDFGDVFEILKTDHFVTISEFSEIVLIRVLLFNISISG
jgi:hypothetical protein